MRHVVRRAFIIEKFPYSEIQDNTIGENLVPIDMLRLKLSFFGAIKFDPRSDKWLRICMFQGAPLPNELKNFDEQWIYKSQKLIMKSLSEIETTSKRASRAVGFSWGIAEEIAKGIRLLELFGLPGIQNLNQYYKLINKKILKLYQSSIKIINQMDRLFVR